MPQRHLAVVCLGFCLLVCFGGFVNGTSELGLRLEVLLALVEADANERDDHYEEYGRHVERDEFDAESFEHRFLLEEALRGRGRRVLFGEFVAYLTDRFYARIRFQVAKLLSQERNVGLHVVVGGTRLDAQNSSR